VYALLEDQSDNIWLTTDKEGVWRYDPATGGFTNFTTREGLCHNSVFCAVEDSSGNIWFGTRGGGLCRYNVRNQSNGKAFTDFTAELRKL
jgi:ligand-binding sensor domain-containing protein